MEINNNDKFKLIALYFTQLHAIPENDRWWGAGFTDWINVKKASPLFEGHNQPRIPLNENYYDQSKIEVLRKQIELAKKYGIFGFCHYHYWFDGKQLLETPTNLLLDNTDLDFPFCLSWANETWSRRWDGQDHQILIKQTHPPYEKNWKLHFDYLVRAWKDERAIKIDGKPIFIIYRPRKIKKLNEMLSFWQKLAKKAGLKGIYFIYQAQTDIPVRHLTGFNAEFRFQPFNAINTGPRNYFDKTANFFRIAHIINFCRDIVKKNLAKKIKGCKYTSYQELSYDRVWEKIIAQEPNNKIVTYKGAFVDWDNTARYKERATIFQNSTPERFEYWLSLLFESILQKNEEKVVFVNAWNEWAEGAYLEPDAKYGYRYLEAIERIIKKYNSN